MPHAASKGRSHVDLHQIRDMIASRRPGYSLPQALYNDPAMHDFDLRAIYGSKNADWLARFPRFWERDTLENLLRDPRISLLFMLPGVDETLRVNGRAALRDEPEITGLFAAERQRPKLVIEVTVEEVYLHCAKAFMRSRLWQADAVDLGAYAGQPVGRRCRRHRLRPRLRLRLGGLLRSGCACHGPL